MSVHPSIRPSVRPTVRPSIRLSVDPYVRPSIRPSVGGPVSCAFFGNADFELKRDLSSITAPAQRTDLVD